MNSSVTFHFKLRSPGGSLHEVDSDGRCWLVGFRLGDIFQVHVSPKYVEAKKLLTDEGRTAWMLAQGLHQKEWKVVTFAVDESIQDPTWWRFRAEGPEELGRNLFELVM
jgi:hypothetical protein